MEIGYCRFQKFSSQIRSVYSKHNAHLLHVLREFKYFATLQVQSFLRESKTAFMHHFVIILRHFVIEFWTAL